MYSYQLASIEELDNLVYDSLVTDSELFHKYHIAAPCNAFKGLNYVIQAIKEADKQYGITLYKITYMGTFTAGFVAIFDNILYSFGINLHHRNTEAVYAFWLLLEKHFGDKEYFCTLHNKNTRAISFLEKECEQKIVNDNDTTTLCL